MPGIRVELLQTSQSLFTDASGRVEFVLPAGEYDARVYGLNGPGPFLHDQDVPATVKPGRPVLVQVDDCDVCVEILASCAHSWELVPGRQLSSGRLPPTAGGAG